MNYLVISPYYPENFQPFTIELAKKEGVKVLGIGQEPYDQLGEALQNAITEYFRVENLEDIEEVKRATAFLFYKHGPIDRVESHNEHWLETDAALRSQFNIFGPKSKDLTKTKLKSEMKTYFKKAGVPVVPGQVITSEQDVQKAIADIGFPMIAKPDNGVGAAATYKLESLADIDQFFAEWDRQTAYFFEQFVTSNEIITYDGLIDHHGNVVYEASLEYVYTPLQLVLEQKDNAYFIHDKVNEKLRQYGQNIIKTFGMKERFFHIEFFRDGDDYIAIEYNNRPAGGFTIDAYNYAHSIDLYRDYASIVEGEAISERRYKPQFSLTISRRDQNHYVYSEEEIKHHYKDHVKMTCRMPEAFAALQGNMIYILTADNIKTINEMVKYIGKTK
ncbi:ATP-grasp domain-containing protein [Streptococcus sp. S784/96/1]|uniref:ATP-grasp domain-containing protein n=1 Tax=Streptococcus sp. S784/96/1 TaxID=2653499 RepID=UPI0013899FC2|nr:ATP-grasp domain-containing protein [Streptococcus sp. S784/96/1]